MPKQRGRVILLVLLGTVLLVGIVGLSMGVLPDAPIAPTPTFAEGIDYPNGRSVPSR